MKEALAKWQGQYQQMNQQERLLVNISVVVVAIGLFYWLLWSPLSNAVDKNRKAVANQTTLLQWVQKNANRAVQLRGAGGSQIKFSGSLPQVANQSAAQLKITISRMQPQGDELLLWVDNAPFNDVLSWLQNLEKRGIAIRDLDVAQTNESGYVKIRRLQLSKA